MPMIIEHIDKIGRNEQRDVLFLVFGHKEPLDFDTYFKYDYEKDTIRDEVIQWLEENAIEYTPCAAIARENGFEKYRGQLYVDVIKSDNPKYNLMCEYLENEDGSFKKEGVAFYYLPLEIAMKNAHHDEPGFWEKWAENF
jgi:hypothetical protein